MGESVGVGDCGFQGEGFFFCFLLSLFLACLQSGSPIAFVSGVSAFTRVNIRLLSVVLSGQARVIVDDYVVSRIITRHGSKGGKDTANTDGIQAPTDTRGRAYSP